jgi:hypothetical protein
MERRNELIWSERGVVGRRDSRRNPVISGGSKPPGELAVFGERVVALVRLRVSRS